MYANKIIKHISGSIVFLLLFCSLIIWDVSDSSLRFGIVEKWLCTAICGLLVVCGLIESIRYVFRLKRISNSFDRDLEKNLRNCKNNFSNQHYFLNDSIFTFDIPDRIFYEDIEDISEMQSRSRYTGNLYFLEIKLKNKSHVKLKMNGSDIFRAVEILKRKAKNDYHKR